MTTTPPLDLDRPATERSEATGRATLRRPSAWRDRDFVKLWTGETVSLFGSQVSELALPLTAILTLHASSAQVGLLNAAKFVPFLLVSLLAGVWIDRCRRRSILITANLGRAALIGALPLAAALGVLTMPQLYLVALLAGGLTVLFDVAYLSCLPSLVERDQLADRNSKLQASASLAGVSGPGVAGVLVQTLTAPVALLVDAGSYLLSAVSLLAIRRPEPAPEAAHRQPLRAEIREGLRLVFGHPQLRALAGEAATFNLFEDFILTVFLLYATRELGLRPSGLGLVLAAGSVGALLGSLAGAPVARRLGLGRALVASMTLACVAPVAFLLARGSERGSLVVLAVSFFAHGAGVAVGNVNMVTLRQSLTPHRLLGRMNASYRLLTYMARFPSGPSWAEPWPG